MAYVSILSGLVLLVFAGDVLVRGAVSIARRYDVPVLVIGLTIVAFGTSAPELVVGIDAVLVGVPALALGNVVGSNIANILLVLGVPALIAPLACDAPRLTKNLLVMLGASLIFIAMAATGQFAWPQGLGLLALLFAFLYWSFIRAKKSPDVIDPMIELDGLETKPYPVGKSAIMITGGAIGLVIGADLLVEGAVFVAREWGVSEEVIGLTLIAIGTSLPELVTSVVAAVRRHCDVAVGNVIGSNLFNLLGIIGVSSLFGTIPVSDSIMSVDLWVMLLATLIILPFCLKRANIGRRAGAGLLISYVAYMIYLLSTAEPALQAIGTV